MALPFVLAPAALVAVTTGTLVELGVFVLLLVFSGLFSGSEVALFSLTDADRETLRAEDSRAARRVLRLLEAPRRLLVTILLFNNLINVGAAILATVLTQRAAEAMGLAERIFWFGSGTLLLFVAQVIVLTFLLLVLSEITPKLIATQRSIGFAKATSGMLAACSRFTYPLTSLLANGTRRLQERFHSPKSVISGEDLKTLADLGERDGTLEEEERALIHSIVEFGETAVREIMVSRLDVHALPETAPLEEALELIRESGHSRFPVYRDHLDNVLGMLYAKDLIPYLNGSGVEPVWSEIVRPAKFVPLGRYLDDMLADFQSSGTHIAVVVDEYGGTAGVVTLEDILEEIVGEIRDEHDAPEPVAYEALSETTYRVDASIDLDDLNVALRLDEHGCALDTNAFDFETLGGLVLHLAGDIPDEGDTVEHERLRMRVEQIEQNRIQRVIVEILPPPPEAEDLLDQ